MKYSVWLDDNKFTYQLLDTRPANSWATLISQCDVSSLRQTLDPWHGTTRSIEDKIKRFNFLIDKLNTWMPVPIIGYFDKHNPVESFNRLHVHFPEYEATETDKDRLDTLFEYNDLIHQIDLGIRRSNEPYILLCPHISIFDDLQEDDYQYFSPEFSFGDLTLHYAHVGRHPMEIAGAKDVNCPPEQIVCQSRISPSHSLRFYNGGKDTKQRFAKFYGESGIKWPYALDDPKLALGYIKLGTLVEVNGSIDLSNALSIVNNSAKITHWEISEHK